MPKDSTAKALEDKFPILKSLGIATDKVIDQYGWDSYESIEMTTRYDRLSQSLAHSSF